MPSTQRLAALAAAERSEDPISEPSLRDAMHTLATAYELAALLGRDALRSNAASAAAHLERSALQIGAARANQLHRALGFPATGDRELLLRHALRVCALAAVAGPVYVAHTRAWLERAEIATRLDPAPETIDNHSDQSAQPAAPLWTVWRHLLLNPSASLLDQLVSTLAAMREQRRGVTDLTPSTNETELRLRFQLFVRERLADAAGLLAVGLRGRTAADQLTVAITAQCTAARSASTGDPNLDLLAAWLELAALRTLAPRISASL
jgi:hypothetical protein